jgi:methylase of polypeptide subunit release factors
VVAAFPGARPPSHEDPGLTTELREVLTAAGFTGEGVRAALRTTGETLARSADVPVHIRRLNETDEPIAALIKLLVLDDAVPADAAKRAFAPLSLDRLEQAGLLAANAAEVQGLVRVVPHDELLIASDQHAPPGEDARPDHVAGVHHPSLTLSRLTVRLSVESTLDVGTGCGIQAILAARHSERVVATDVNARALEFAAFNARLNGVDNVEFREGSFFEPARGSRFQLVVCNPPYVISPETEFLFRDSGMSGDTVSRHVVREAPTALEDGAFAQMLVSWIVEPDGDWSSSLRAWVEGCGCDAWLLHHGTDDAIAHTGKWLRHEAGTDLQAYAEAAERWLAYLERLGIEQIAVGAVILRRRSGANWVRADELPSDRLRPASDHILRVFAGNDVLASLPDPTGLLGKRLVLADQALLEQHAVFREREWCVDEISLALQDGLGFRASLDPTLVAMLTALDGKLTLGEAASELAQTEGESPEAVAHALLPAAREMLAAGFLVLA